jgi:outer membrane protein assembly factor BamB
MKVSALAILSAVQLCRSGFSLTGAVKADLCRSGFSLTNGVNRDRVRLKPDLHHVRSIMLFCLALAALFASNAPAQEWPQFRGPGGQGHASTASPTLHWSESENIRWKTPIEGLGWSSPVIAGNQVWLTTAIESSGSLRAVCINRESGAIEHDVEVFRKNDLGRIAAKNSHASPTPVVDDHQVYVHFGAHGTAALARDGQIVWTRELEYDHRHGPGGSPVVWQDLLIVTCDGPDVQYTVALDKHTGQVRWRADHQGQQAYSTPLVIGSGAAAQLITSQGEALVAYRPQDGAELWRCRHGGHSVVPRPVAGNGLIYFCTGYWTPSLMAVRTGGSGDVTDSRVAFTLRRGVPHTPSPLLDKDRLYLVSDQGVLACVDAVHGTEVWQKRLGGSFSASPTLVDGKIFLTSESGATFIVANGDEFRLLAENHVDGRTLASPAFVDGAMFLRSDTHLYRIEEAKNLRASATRTPAGGATFRR